MVSSLLRLLLWQAPLGVRSVKHRHQSPEWTILNYAIQGEVTGFRVSASVSICCRTNTTILWWHSHTGTLAVLWSTRSL